MSFATFLGNHAVAGTPDCASIWSKAFSSEDYSRSLFSDSSKVAPSLREALYYARPEQKLGLKIIFDNAKLQKKGVAKIKALGLDTLGNLGTSTYIRTKDMGKVFQISDIPEITQIQLTRIAFSEAITTPDRLPSEKIHPNHRAKWDQFLAQKSGTLRLSIRLDGTEKELRALYNQVEAMGALPFGFYHDGKPYGIFDVDGSADLLLRVLSLPDVDLAEIVSP